MEHVLRNGQSCLEWCREIGARSSVELFCKDGMLGLKAVMDISEGQNVLTIPKRALIHLGTATSSDLGQALSRLGALPPDWVLLIWTMVDRHDKESEFRHFWAALPAQLSSGLSCSEEIVEALEGSSAFQTFQESRQHVQDQYTEMEPLLASLVKAYPTLIKEEHVDLDSYIWAVQLWYSYAMEACQSLIFFRVVQERLVQVDVGGIQQCLVPGAHFFNHSLDSSIRNYGRLEKSGQAMSFAAASRCKRGEEVFLSYGQLPNEHLLLFYGFSLINNGSDTIAIKVGPEETLQLGLGQTIEPAALKEMPISASQVKLGIEASQKRLHKCLTSLEGLQKDTPNPFLKYAAIYISAQLDLCSWHLQNLPAR